MKEYDDKKYDDCHDIAHCRGLYVHHLGLKNVHRDYNARVGFEESQCPPSYLSPIPPPPLHTLEVLFIALPTLDLAARTQAALQALQMKQCTKSSFTLTGNCPQKPVRENFSSDRHGFEI